MWGTGEYLGVERPDTYTYSFDYLYGADEIRAIDDGADDIVKAS